MALPDLLRVAGIAVALSGITPAILVVTQTVGRGSLWLVFLPSVLVGFLTACYARREVRKDRRWDFEEADERLDTQR